MVRGIALRGERQGVADAVEPAHAAVSFAPWIASARVRVKASSAAAAASPCAAMISTSADPTTTPSATLAISAACAGVRTPKPTATRSEEHTSELQSLMRISYAVFCLKKKNTTNTYSTMYH